MTTRVRTPRRRRTSSPADRPSWAGRATTWLLPALVVLLLALRQAFRIPHTGLGMSPAQLLVLVAALLWVLALLARDPGVVGARHPLGVVLVAAVVVSLLGWAQASRSVALPVEGDDPDGTLLNALSLTLLSLFTMAVLRTPGAVRTLLRWLVLGAGLAGLIAVVSAATGTEVAELLKPPGFTEAAALDDVIGGLLRQGVDRTRGTSGHPLEMGALMTVLTPVCLGVGFDARRRGERSWPPFLAGALCLAAATASVSRSAVVGLAAALLVMGLCWPLRRTLGVAAAVVAGLLGLLLAGSSQVTALLSIVVAGDPDSSLYSRALGRDFVAQNFSRSPWLGTGPGRSLPGQPTLDNDYLTTLLTAGILGLVVSVTLLLGAVVVLLRRRGDAQLGELATGVAGALVALAVIRLVLDTGGFVQISTLFAVLVGVAAAVGSQCRPTAGTRAVTAGPAPATA